MGSKFDIKKNLDEVQTVLLMIPSGDYNNNIIQTARDLSLGKVCYVTMNKTYDSLKEIFKKKKINTENFIFVDCISKTIKSNIKNSNDCIYCSSPAALTEISLTISKILKHNLDYLIFDSITNLLIYEKKSPITKFISSLVNKIKNTKTNAVFYALSVKEQEGLIKQSGMFVDKVIDLEKINK